MNTTMRENAHTLARVGLIAAAVICTTLVWLIAELIGLDVSVRMDGVVQAISGITVAVSTGIASLGAWAVKAAMERLFRHPTSWWVTISIALGVVSLAGPLTMATSAIASAILVVMHVIPAAILIPGLTLTGPQAAHGIRRRQDDPALSAKTETASMGSGYGGAP